MNADQLEAALTTFYEGDNYHDIQWGEIPYDLDGINDELKIDGEAVKLEVVEDFGGEGQGDNRYIVIKATRLNETKYFTKHGWYSSYEGSDWDGDFEEVEPIQKTITVYEKKVA